MVTTAGSLGLLRVTGSRFMQELLLHNLLDGSRGHCVRDLVRMVIARVHPERSRIVPAESVEQVKNWDAKTLTGFPDELVNVPEQVFAP